MRVDLRDFERAYAENDDPWAFATSAYEQQKYDTTIANLNSRRYRRCFEPACSIGVLTARLADRVDHVVACDSSPAAIARARQRLAGTSNVELLVANLPEQWPTGTFDLIVFSELGYYWDEDGLGTVLDKLASSLSPGADLLAVHWLGTSEDHLLHGSDVHRIMRKQFGTPSISLASQDNRSTIRSAFLIDRWDNR
jgi:SAM-dependent methyltransferase